jgi:hypothetical protein
MLISYNPNLMVGSQRIDISEVDDFEENASQEVNHLD